MSILDRLRGKTEKNDKLTAKKKAETLKISKVKDIKQEKKSVVPKSEKAGAKKEKSVKRNIEFSHNALVALLVTEKSAMLGQLNKYVFKVNPKAQKRQIKDAIEGYYGVGVTKINTIKISPKKRIQGRTVGYKQGYKKAVVTLRQGDTIGAAEGV